MHPMGVMSGITYNFKGLWLGIRTPRLLLLGGMRLAALVVVTVLLGGLVVAYRQDILSMLWRAPESPWVLWLWHLLSWLISLILFGISALVGYLVSQLLFSLLIMDVMSKITEKMITGGLSGPPNEAFFRQFVRLIKQEIPRATFPVALLLLLMGMSWITPLAPVISVVSSLLAVVFLAWDNTDLTEARRLVSFKRRFGFLMKTLPFHIGFGLPFLIPVLNVVLLSFAPVGATLFQLENDAKDGRAYGHFG